MKRLIAGWEYTNSDILEKRTRVLMGLSLFDKVGYKDRLCKEAEWVAEKILE